MPDIILLTGGAGFIGRHLCRALLERGDTVRVLHDRVFKARPEWALRGLAA